MSKGKKSNVNAQDINMGAKRTNNSTAQQKDKNKQRKG